MNDTDPLWMRRLITCPSGRGWIESYELFIGDLSLHRTSYLTRSVKPTSRPDIFAIIGPR